MMDCILLVPRPMQESVVLLKVPSSRLHHPSEEMAWKWFVRAWVTALEKSSQDVCLRIFKAHIVCSHSKSSEQLLLGWISPTEILKGILRASVRRRKRWKFINSLYRKKKQEMLPNKISRYEGFKSTSKDSYLINIKPSLLVLEQILVSQAHHGFFGSTQSELFVISVVQSFRFYWFFSFRKILRLLKKLRKIRNLSSRVLYTVLIFINNVIDKLRYSSKGQLAYESPLRVTQPWVWASDSALS